MIGYFEGIDSQRGIAKSKLQPDYFIRLNALHTIAGIDDHFRSLLNRLVLEILVIRYDDRDVGFDISGPVTFSATVQIRDLVTSACIWCESSTGTGTGGARYFLRNNGVATNSSLPQR